MNFYKKGECRLGGDVIVVKKDFDLSLHDHKVVERNNLTGKTTVLIDFENISNTGFNEKLFLELIEKYGDVKKYCYAEITLIDMIALISVLCDALPHLGLRKHNVLEIGSWGGASSFVISSVIQSFHKENKLVCMDTWKGTPDTDSHCIANFEDMYNHFSSVMEYFGTRELIIPIITCSEYGIDLLEDHLFDAIFIDASHTYSGVKSDIEKAIPKIRKGGVLIGHDCECYYSELPKLGMNKDLEEAEGYHVGVINALHDLFGKNFNIVPGSKIWYRYIS